ncbi:MAG TPA: hypothetical protein VEB22_02310, partial [Phycisphaerales bacterium]|nr:hypothetical protein [Phycisphaerales bacterium]
QNAGNSEEMASSAEELSSQVASLNELVAQFKVSTDSHNAHPVAPAARHRVTVPRQPDGKSAKGQRAVVGHSAGTTQSAAQVIPMENDEALASF